MPRVELKIDYARFSNKLTFFSNIQKSKWRKTCY